jgi:hypothetical protein
MCLSSVSPTPGEKKIPRSMPKKAKKIPAEAGRVRGNPDIKMPEELLLNL